MQTYEKEAAWLDAFKSYFGNGSEVFEPQPVAGRPLLNKPLRALWYKPPVTHSRGYDFYTYLTHHRHEVFAADIEEFVKGIGFDVANIKAMSQSRWEATFDGMHYIMGIHQDIEWQGCVGSQFEHVVLNYVFPSCGTPDMEWMPRRSAPGVTGGRPQVASGRGSPASQQTGAAVAPQTRPSASPTPSVTRTQYASSRPSPSNSCLPAMPPE